MLVRCSRVQAKPRGFIERLIASAEQRGFYRAANSISRAGFYRASNSIFGKVGRIASEEVVLHLVKYKCLPILLYGFEVLNLNKSQLNSLDFVANRFLMKLFNTNNMQIIEFCCEQFNFVLPSRQIANRRDKFIKSVSPRTNLLTFVNM